MKVLAPQAVAPTTVSVAPTETTLATVDVSQSDRIAIQVENLDASQTLSLKLYEKASSTNGYGRSELVLPDVGPLTSSPLLKYQCAGAAAVKVTGTMSGAGGNARITVRRVNL